MSSHADSSTLTFRFPDNGALAQPPTSRTPIPMSSSQSQSPRQISSWHSHSHSEPGSVPSVFSARLDQEQMAFSNMGYDYSRRGSYPPGWDFTERVNGYDARQDVLAHPVDPLTQTPYINGPRGKLDQLFPRIRTYEVIYTDDAMMKLGHGVHRRCFNCKTHETTTWRRSMLSPGKLLCNKCGLFERTHSVPRPKTFPRRRRSLGRSNVVSNDGIDKHRHYHNNHSAIVPPHSARSFNSFDSVSDKMLSPDALCVTHDTSDVSSSPACYPDIQQSTIYSAGSHLPPTDITFTTPSW